MTTYSHIILVTGSRGWTSAELVRGAFARAWVHLGVTSVTRPLLVSGHASRGADRIAEMVWDSAGRGFEKVLFEADWPAYGRAAGPRRNQEMVDFVASQVQQKGSEALCVGFAAFCVSRTCDRSAAGVPHLSHGTADCLARAARAGIESWTTSAPMC